MCNSAMERGTFEEMTLSCRVDEGAVLILGDGVDDLRYSFVEAALMLFFLGLTM